jgi:hypothetical protein
MFRHARIPWDILLAASVMVIVRRHGITEGCLAIDETDKKRSKSAKFIHKLHKIKDKASGGYINGQKLVFLVLISGNVTIPVGFDFYMPDPELKAWKKSDEMLKKQGVAKADRPARPSKNESYPTIPEIALKLLKQFKANHGEIKVKCILADALYGTREFLDEASKVYGGVQVVSQIKENQNVLFRNKKLHVRKYFASRQGVEQAVSIRGKEKTSVTVASARLRVCSHGRKRFVIALKYPGEEEYRYLVATDLSWRTLDIVEAYSLRWLIEVVFEDWKVNEGWDRLTKHVGEDGSRRGVILSLLSDHCLFLHPDQTALLDDKLAACTVGSLIRRIRIDCFLQLVRDIIADENPDERLESVAEILKSEIYDTQPSSKHMSGKRLGRLEPTASLKYKNVA